MLLFSNTFHFARRMSSTTSWQTFGHLKIPMSTVFYQTDRTVAFVNLRPILAGHVLVVPKRVVPRLAGLTDEELWDLWKVARDVQAMIEHKYGAESSNLAIQDGKFAGQSVAHVHIHIVPRHRSNSQDKEDAEIHRRLEWWAPTTSDEKEKLGIYQQVEIPLVRKDRTMEEMEEEAKQYQELMGKIGDITKTDAGTDAV